MSINQLLFTYPFPPIPIINLVTNGDMELDSNWASEGAPTSNTRSTDQVHGGVYSRKVVTNAAWQGIRSDNFTTEAGKTYTVEAWAYCEASAAAIIVYNGDGTSFQIFNAFGSAGAWGSYFNASYTDPNPGSAARVVFFLAASETTYIDDVFITENP